MTAHFVLLAQTKVGFLSGGRSRRMRELPEKEVLAQLEEAYARATVALTRAQKLCIIMGPLDMRGLLGAATVICENHARKMRTFFTRRLEPKTKSSNAFKWSLRPKRK